MSSEPTLSLRSFVSLVRGTTYKGGLVGQPGPALLGLASIQPDGGFRRGSFKTYGGESPTNITLGPGDVYVSLKDVTQSGDLLGSVARVPRDIVAGRLTQDTVKLQFDGKPISHEYVYWLLRTPAYRAYCRSHATGTTTLGLARDDFLDFPLAEPGEDDLSLVELLEALDDRVALLRETNATLETIARMLFKSWFVDFDPVRAKSQGLAPAGMDEAMAALFPDGFEESERGPAPRGWRWVSLRDVVTILDSKRVPLSGQERALRRGPFPYYGAAALMDHVDDYLFDGIHVLVGEDGSVTQPDGAPVLQYVWGRFWVNNHAHVLQGADGICTEHVLLSLRCTNIQHLVTGAVQAKLSQGNMWRIDFMLPSPEVARVFGSIVEPLFARYRQNAEQAGSLTEIRDTLLPRLISGRLRLPEAEAVAD